MKAYNKCFQTRMRDLAKLQTGTVSRCYLLKSRAGAWQWSAGGILPMLGVKLLRGSSCQPCSVRKRSAPTSGRLELRVLAAGRRGVLVDSNESTVQLPRVRRPKSSGADFAATSSRWCSGARSGTAVLAFFSYSPSVSVSGGNGGLGHEPQG